MYLYQSLYGPEHFLGHDFSYNGRPVMHRLERERFRTVHSLFTPMALEAASAQELVDVALDYLFYLDGESSPPPTVGSAPLNRGEK